MANNAHAGIIGQHTFDARGHFVGTVGAEDLAGMLRITNAHATAVVDGNPGGSAGGVDESVEKGPIGNGVGAIPHGFGFAVGRGYGAAVEMVTANYDGSF